MKRLFLILLSASLLFSLTLPITSLADKANNTFIYAIEGDPGNDINTISTSGAMI